MTQGKHHVKYKIRFNNVTGCRVVCKICGHGSKKGCNPRPTISQTIYKNGLSNVRGGK